MEHTNYTARLNYDVFALYLTQPTYHIALEKNIHSKRGLVDQFLFLKNVDGIVVEIQISYEIGCTFNILIFARKKNVSKTKKLLSDGNYTLISIVQKTISMFVASTVNIFYRITTK